MLFCISAFENASVGFSSSPFNRFRLLTNKAVTQLVELKGGTLVEWQKVRDQGHRKDSVHKKGVLKVAEGHPSCTSEVHF